MLIERLGTFMLFKIMERRPNINESTPNTFQIKIPKAWILVGRYVPQNFIESNLHCPVMKVLRFR